MFAYDPDVAAALQNPPPRCITDVVKIMQSIDATCVDGDGLKWFNRLYLQVTLAVQGRLNQGGFANLAWLAQLDIQFAQLYFGALKAALAGEFCPGCWAAMFGCRENVSIARIQFALAGMNAHINHDLPEAIVSTCKITNTVPDPGGALHRDYTAVNDTLISLIETAKQELHVRLLGDALPPVSHLEDLLAGWNVSVARENAWHNAEGLWNLPAPFAAGLMESIDGFTTVIGKALLIPAP